MPADLILHDGRFWTGAGGPLLSAVAVLGDRIVAVGDDGAVAPWRGSGTRVVNLRRRVVLPGLIDAHTHILEYGRRLGQLDLSACATLPAAVESVRAFATGSCQEWILGGGWDSNHWAAKPTAAALDVATSRPVALRSHDCHSVWANTAALRAAGIGSGTPDPSGGVIERDESGSPTGVLRENATRLIDNVTPAPSPAADADALDRALAQAAGHGLTCVHTFEGPEVLSASQELRREGRARIRLRCHLRRDSLDDALRLGLRTGLGDSWLRIGSLKLFADGALGTQTAWMLQPYEGRDGYLGVPTLAADECEREISRAARGGIASAVHAIGDAANHMVLNSFEATAADWRPRGLRQRIEHAQCLAPSDLTRLAEIGIIASMQPTHAVSDYIVADKYWGVRCRRAYAWRTLLDNRTRLAFGSDAPVESLDPLLGIYAAVTRQRADGTPQGGWRPEERLTIDEAITAYTAGPAYASGEEAELGRISAGSLADVVILERDPWSEGVGWLNAGVAATMVGGHLAHGSLDELAQ